MDIKEFSKRIKETDASGLDFIADQSQNKSDLILDQVRESNKKSLKTIRFMIRLIMGAMVVLVIVFMFNPDPEMTYAQRVQGGFLFLAFVLYIPFAYKAYMKLKYLEYGMSTREFIDISEERLRYWTKDSWMLVPYILLLLGGLNTTVFARYWPDDWSLWLGILLVNGGFFLIMGFALWSSIRQLRKDKKPLLVKLLELKDAVNEE